MDSRTRLPLRKRAGVSVVRRRSLLARTAQHLTRVVDKQRSALVLRRVLIVGAGEPGCSLGREIEAHFPSECQVVGFVEDDAGALTDGRSVLGSREEIDELLRRHEVDEVIVADPLTGRRGGAAGYALISAHRGSGVDEWSDSDQGQWPETLYARHSRLALQAKRAFDVLFAVVALAVGAPWVALAAIAIKASSRGPVLYRQERVGRDGRLFTIYKLRTMIDGAENETGPTLASTDDPRSTWIGGILRTTKLDECPQFYNVLRGDMSIVGPRPERPCFVQEFARHLAGYSERHSIRPGITGLAQVRGGYRTHVYIKLQYDLTYVRKQSLWLDLWIMVLTPLSILRGARTHE